MPITPTYVVGTEAPDASDSLRSSQLTDLLEPETTVEDPDSALHRAFARSGEWDAGSGGGMARAAYHHDLTSSSGPGGVKAAYQADLTSSSGLHGVSANAAYQSDLGSSSGFAAPPAASAATSLSSSFRGMAGASAAAAAAASPGSWPARGAFADPSLRVAMKKSHGEEAFGVKYIRDGARLERYRVTLGYALLRGGKDGGPKTRLDTASVKKHFMEKRGGGFGERSKIGQKGAPLGTAAMRTPLEKGWNKQSLIWVCVPEGDSAVFYSHVGKIQRFHHSSFSAGGDVLGAGEWVVEDGRLRTIAAVSGHYQPSLTSLLTCIRIIIAGHGNDFDVLLYRLGGGWEAVPARELGPDGGGVSGYVAFPADSGVV